MQLNFWPFNRPKPLTHAEWSATQPPAPCGNQEEHYSLWVFDIPCPICAGIEEAKRKDAELDALADKIVKKLKDGALLKDLLA